MLRLFLFSLLLCFSTAIFGQGNPTGLPTATNTGKWYWFKQYIQADSGILMVSRDTGFLPKQPILTFWLNPGIDTSIWAHNGRKWVRQLNTRDLGNALSGSVKYGDSLIVFATPTSSRKYADSVAGLRVRYSDSTTKYVTPTQGAAAYYPRAGNPSGFLTTNQTITLTGDVTGSGSTTISVSVNRFGGQLPAYYLDRTNHFGTQPISSITGLQPALDAVQGAYDSAYYSNASITLRKLNGNFDNIPLDSLGVYSFNGRFGAVTSKSGDYITDSVPQGNINKYYKDSLARLAIGVLPPLTYNGTNGIIGIPKAGMATDGYLSSADYNLFKAAATPIDTSSLSNRINLKMDTLYQNGTMDSLIYTIGGRRHAIYNPGDTLDPAEFVKYSDTTNLIVTYTSGDDRYVTREPQAPISTLTPSFVFQKRTGDTTVTVTAGYGRRAATSSARATPNITAVVVDGVSRSFTNPSPGVTNTIPISVTFTGNTNRTVNNVVTAGTPTTSSITGQFFFTYYRGFADNSNPTDTDLWGLGQNVFPSSAKGTSGNTLTLPAPPSAQWYVFAYPASLGTASFVINGFGATLTLIQRNVTNTNGFTEIFNIYVAQTPTAGSITYLIN